MRIALVNRNRRQEGGVEIYLNSVIPALHRAGHEVSFCYELDLPPERDAIALPPGSPAWCVATTGTSAILAAVRKWRPDVICTHNVSSVELERQIMGVAPSVLFAHDYRGACISGSKAFKRPIARTCERRFGWQCLVQFYPKRCGGLSPLTMFVQYRIQAQRLELIKRYRSVVTHSKHMRSEYIRHGIPAERVFSLPYCVLPLGRDAGQLPRWMDRTPESGLAWRLVFAGRMDQIKGGLVLLEALPFLRSATSRPLHLVFAGDGPMRSVWETVSAKLCRATPNVHVEFPGWLREADLAALFDASDLLIVPSVFPEPFGTVGVKAGLEGLPAAAFAVGGITEWLVDGANGHVAAGSPLTAAGLAGAIVKCLADHNHYLDLRKGAARLAQRFTAEVHVTELIRILQAATQS